MFPPCGLCFAFRGRFLLGKSKDVSPLADGSSHALFFAHSSRRPVTNSTHPPAPLLTLYPGTVTLTLCAAASTTPRAEESRLGKDAFYSALVVSLNVTCKTFSLFIVIERQDDVASHQSSHST